MSLVPRFDPAKVLEVIQRDRVTVFEGVPTMYIALLHHPDRDDYDLSSLRVGISGGAPIPAEVIDAFERTFGIVDPRGLRAVRDRVDDDVQRQRRGAPHLQRRQADLGRRGARSGTTTDRPLPAGRDHVGELVVRGVNVMRGYHGNPEATAEAFAGGWFHTGDLGYVDEDGFFFIVDRKKDLIIRGGYNVYPREVEDVLYTHPAVAEAAVVGVPDDAARRGGQGVRRAPARAATATEQELIAYVKERRRGVQVPADGGVPRAPAEERRPARSSRRSSSRVSDDGRAARRIPRGDTAHRAR